MQPDAPNTIPTPKATQWPDTTPGAAFAPDVQVQLSWADMAVAVRKGAIAPHEAHALWAEWADPGNPRRVHRKRVAPTSAEANGGGARFSFAHVLYYFGGLLTIGAMSLFMTLGWDVLGPWGSAALAAGYLALAWKVAAHLKKRALPMPAGILATLAVCLVPLLVWSVQVGLGLWPEGGSTHYPAFHQHINWRWLMLELATLAAAVVMLRQMKLPFMVMPVAVTLWYLNMDVAHLLMQTGGFDWALTRDVSMVFGLATCALAVWVDVRTRLATRVEDRQDFAFWLYLFGALMFWAGLSLRESSSEWGKLGYAAINVALVLGGAAIGRRVFTVLGGLGVAVYLGYLSSRVFHDSLGFTFALTLLGLAVVALGVWWQRHEHALHARLSPWLPAALRPLAHPPARAAKAP